MCLKSTKSRRLQSGCVQGWKRANSEPPVDSVDEKKLAGLPAVEYQMLRKGRRVPVPPSYPCRRQSVPRICRGSQMWGDQGNVVDLLFETEEWWWESTEFAAASRASVKLALLVRPHRRQVVGDFLVVDLNTEDQF